MAYILDHAEIQLYPQVDFVLLTKLKQSDACFTLDGEIKDPYFWDYYVSASGTKQASLIEVMRIMQKIS